MTNLSRRDISLLCRSIAAATLLALVAAAPLAAQTPLRARWGLFGGLAFNRHTADFRALPGVPNCCPLFESGSGAGLLAGLRYEFPLSGSMLLSVGASYEDHSALLETSEAVAIVAGGEVRNGAFRHTIDASLASVGIAPMLAFRAADHLFVRAGIRLGAVLSPTYAQKEEIVDPAGAGTFLDSLGNDTGSRTRNENAGALPNASSLLAQAVAGVEYELPVNAAGTLMLVPGVSYALGVTDLVSGYTWKPNALRLTLGLTYAPPPSRDVIRDTLYRRDTAVVVVARDAGPGVRLDERTATTDRSDAGGYDIEHTTIVEHYRRETPKQTTLTASVAAVGLDGGREANVAALRIEEFLQTNTHPLLGYLFFAEGSPELPERYVRLTREAAERFQPSALFGEDAMGITHNVLNIVGDNLRRHPAARLTITGCNANAGVEKGNRELSRRRAESVRSYLVDVWGIAPERLSVADRDLPAVPSNQQTADGAAENRRVEITSDDPEVTDVFVAHDTTRTANPPALRFRIGVRSSEPVASWHLKVAQHGLPLKEFTGTGTPPATLDWRIADDERSAPRFSEPLDIAMDVRNADGDTAGAAATLATNVITIQRKQEQRSRDYRVERYNLVLFDVGTSTITAAHRRTIGLVRSRLEAGSTVTIEGFSDRTGDADANRRLARARAGSTAAALGRSDVTVVGVGEDRLLYDNDLPEGRFYCRTVRIMVRTPVR